METERKLATIQTVKELLPIPDADAIELCKMESNSWPVVVKKGDFAIGDKGIYFEIDSILPDIPIFEFMRQRHFIVKTVKLRKQLSQGLLMPLTILADPEMQKLFKDKTDLTELLNVTKHEKPEVILQGNTTGSYFPYFLRKTDEERIQNWPEILKFLEEDNTKLYITEKVDGSSFTAYLDEGAFGVCSRNYDLQKGESKFWKVAEDMQIEEKNETIFR